MTTPNSPPPHRLRAEYPSSQTQTGAFQAASPGLSVEDTMSQSHPLPPSPSLGTHPHPPHRRPPPPRMPNPLLVPDDQPCPPNPTMFQGFEWYCPADHCHWKRLVHAVPALARLGVTSMWIPPATKAAQSTGNGYDVYDLYDLGEFDQKGHAPTKWGNRAELLEVVRVASEHGVGVLFDAVLNHKAGADFAEDAVGTRVDPRDRNKALGEPEAISTWTGFNFPGRGGAYSQMQWCKDHFTGIDWDQRSKQCGIWRFKDKKWAADVAHELGNYDYLMFADLDHRHPDVRADIFGWLRWLRAQLGVGLRGLRLDAVKHYSRHFVRDLVRHIDEAVDPGWFVVGEYWCEDSAVLADYVEYMNNRISLFDVRLVANFSRLSLAEEPDLRDVFEDAFLLYKPHNAVTFVANHDTQFGQSLEKLIAPYFVPLAYSLILLRANAGLPCVFYADLYGSLGPPCWPGLDHHPTAAKEALGPAVAGGNLLPRLMLARHLWAYGTQVDYLDGDENDRDKAAGRDTSGNGGSANTRPTGSAAAPLRPGRVTTIGFTRSGHPSQSRGDGLAVLMTCGWEITTKAMCVGTQHAGERWTDVLRWCPGEVLIDENGWGTFSATPRSVSVWVRKDAEGRKAVDAFVFDRDVYGLQTAQEHQEAPSHKPHQAVEEIS